MTEQTYPACSSCVREPVGRINVARFIAKLDACLARNDLPAAGKCLTDWEAEARGLGDERGPVDLLDLAHPAPEPLQVAGVQHHTATEASQHFLFGRLLNFL